MGCYMWKAGCVTAARRKGHCLLILLMLIAALGSAVAVSGQTETDPVAGLREHNAPGLLIVIFSPEVDSSRRTMAQGVVWKRFIAKLKKKKITSLEAVNEVAINQTADRARAFELASGEQYKYTLWLQFAALREQPDNDRSNSTESERLVAKYILFAPASNTIIAQGEVEQERIPVSRYETANNQKPIRDNSGRVVNAKPASRLPDGSSSNGPQVLDIDTLERVGELVGERVVSAVVNYEKKKAM